MNLKRPHLRAQVACAIAALGTSALLAGGGARFPCRCVGRTLESIEACDRTRSSALSPLCQSGAATEERPTTSSAAESLGSHGCGLRS